MNELSVIILNWNGRDDTLACVRSLLSGTREARHIVVVDNASGDGLAEALATMCRETDVSLRRMVESVAVREVQSDEAGREEIRRIPSGVVLIEAESNLGFCVGNNLGTSWAFAAGATSCLILNNDTEADRDLLKRLDEASRQLGPNVLISPQILYADGTEEVWWCGGEFSSTLNPSYRNQRQPRQVGVEGFPVSEWVSGCATLISEQLFREIGLYDPVFFIWCEEWDLSLRAASKGVPMRVAPEAIVYHKVGRSLGIVSPLTFFYAMRNMRILRRRYMPSLQRTAFNLFYWPWKAVQAIVFSFRFRSVKYALAYVDSLRSSGGIWSRQS